MDLYFIRHAIAQDLGNKNDFSDEKRALTGDGRSRMRDIAKGLARLGLDVDLLLTSPLVRAVETASIVAEALELKNSEVKQTRNLAPSADAHALFAELKSYGASSIGLVGHQPDLGDLVSMIVGGSGGLSIDLRKGGVCYVEVTETIPAFRGDLVWLLTPKQLRTLAK